MIIKFSTSPAVFRWRPACWLKVAGEDAATFLQGQFTNDLRGLKPGSAVYGLWLTVKGKVLADSFVVGGSGQNEFWVGSYFSSADVVRQRIESHVIADDVTVEDQTSQWAGVSVLGESAGERIKLAKGAHGFAGRREASPNWECIYRVNAEEPEWMASLAAGVAVLDSAAMEQRRIEAGIPAVPRDIGPADLPNEAGLDGNAISYTKGCYLGQEVMARLKSMGQVRRRLLRVTGRSGEVPTGPVAVFAGARQAGELRSAVADGAGGWIGLVMVSLLHVADGRELSFAAEAPAAMRLVDTP